MRWVRFSQAGHTAYGIVEGTKIIDPVYVEDGVTLKGGSIGPNVSITGDQSAADNGVWEYERDALASARDTGPVPPAGTAAGR